MTREIEVAEKTAWNHRSSLQLEDSIIDEDDFIFWRAKEDGFIKMNGFMSIDDAERLGYWLFGVVNDYRARQAGERTPEQIEQDNFQRRWR